MSNIFIPAGVRDKAMRDTLISIVREMNKLGDAANIKLYDQDPGPSTAGTAGDIIYSESSNSIWVFSNDNNWVLTAGISDSQASQGYTGTKKFTGTLYYQSVQSSNPGAPTAATWSIPNNDFLSITPSGVWSHTQPPVTITDTSVREWHTNYTVTLDTSVDPITSTVTFSYPEGAIQVTDDIESDNYSPGSSGWAIRRDDGYAEFGAAAIRGQLTGNQIAANAITASKINVSSLDAISANLGSITVGSANIGNLAVRNINLDYNSVYTGNILSNAVTLPQLATGSAITDVPRTTTTASTFATLVVTGSGAPAQIRAYFTVSWFNSSNNIDMTGWAAFNVSLKVNGSTMAGLNGAYVSGINSPTIMVSGQTYISGFTVITLEMANTGLGTAAKIRYVYPRIEYLELKR